MKALKYFIPALLILGMLLYALVVHAAIIDSYVEANQNTSVSFDTTGAGSNDSVGQSFTGDGSTLGSVDLYLTKIGSPTGTLTAYIYAHSGTFGSSSVPTGAALATSTTYDVSNLTGSFQLINFLFTGDDQITLTNTTKYVVVVTISGGSSDSSNRPNWGADSSSPTHDGNTSRNINDTWAAISTFDQIFYVNTPAPVAEPMKYLVMTNGATKMTNGKVIMH